jgi:hypothetical protein
MDGGQLVTCSRDVAVIYYLTRDWAEDMGGVLLDLEGGQAFVPQFNSAVAFRVPRYHEVTPLTTQRARYSVGGPGPGCGWAVAGLGWAGLRGTGAGAWAGGRARGRSAVGGGCMLGRLPARAMCALQLPWLERAGRPPCPAAAAQIFGWFLVPGILYDLFTGEDEGEEQGQQEAEEGDQQGAPAGGEEGPSQQQGQQRDGPRQHQHQQQQQQGATKLAPGGKQHSKQAAGGSARASSSSSSSKKRKQREAGAAPGRRSGKQQAAAHSNGAAGSGGGESPVQCKLKQRLLAKLRSKHAAASDDE